MVQITALDWGAAPRPSWPLGTGFIVSDEGVVVTANHVVRGGEAFAAGASAGARRVVGIGVPYADTQMLRGNSHVTHFDVVAIDERHDLALLRMRENPFHGIRSGIVIEGQPAEIGVSAATLTAERPLDGDRIAVSGYPLGEPVLVTTSGNVASSWAVNVTTQAPQLHVDDVYLGDVQTNGGNSGGPVYQISDSAVIGVLVGSRVAPVFTKGSSGELEQVQDLFASADLSVIVPSRYVIELLEGNGIAWGATE